MIAREHRLTVKGFTKAFSTGKRFSGKDIQIIYTPGTELHIAVVVGTKVTKSKPIRNSMRRRVYTIMREFHADRTGTYIFLIQKSALTYSYAMLARSVATLLERVM